MPTPEPEQTHSPIQEASDISDSDVSLDEEDEELVGRVFYSEEPHLPDDVLPISEDEKSDLGEMSDTELEQVDDPELVARYKKLKSRKPDSDLNEEDRKRLMISNFTDDQMDRFEAYRRTTVNKPGVKKICNGVLGQLIPQNLAVILAGLSKLYLSEIITKAFEVQEREYKAKLIMAIDEKKRHKKQVLKNIANGKDVDVKNIDLVYEGDIQTPLRPEHIREAIRLYKLENSSAFNAQWRSQGEADGKLFR